MSYSENEKVNRKFYDEFYDNVDFKKHHALYDNFNTEFLRLKQTHASWGRIFSQDFMLSVKDKLILEIGAGDCYHAMTFAMFGARVYVNDISVKTRGIVKYLNEKFKFNNEIIVVEEDLKTFSIDNKFDVIIGIDIIHHLDEQLEEQIMRKLITLLNERGKIYFFEPIENSKVLKFMKNLFASGNRPSILFYKRFNYYRNNLDPHPIRSNSNKHYRKMAKIIGLKVSVNCYGYFYNFVNFFPQKKKTLLNIDGQIEKYVFLRFLFAKLARNAVIIYQH